MGMRAEEAGLSDELEWSACEIDPDQITPICGIEKGLLQKWFIAAYNPSTVNVTSFHINVSGADNATYKVYSIQDAQWSEVDSDLLCYNTTADTRKSKSYTVCDLFVDYTVLPQQSQHFKIEIVNATKPNITETNKDKPIMMITNDYYTLTW